jgi:hypothetical protein
MHQGGLSLCKQCLRRTCSLIKPWLQKLVLRTFRLSDPRMEAKSVRRGSLQCMASSGVPITIIKAHAHTETASQLHSSTKYTSKDVTRRGVLQNDAGCQFDYAAWFDQIPLEESIRKYFGVSKHIAFFVLPMGFCPSCEVAEALTEAIADTTIPVTTPTCVDNVLFQGTSTNTSRR